MQEQPIIAPVSLDLIKAELTPLKKLRDTNKGKNEIYVINHHDSPNVMREIARLREEAFRDSGGGSGMEMDIDEFDTMENPYQQLIVWDPDAQRILGGYRYILGTDIKLDEKGQPLLATAHMFHFSERFVMDYLPYTIELGRSFVSPDYQSSKAGTKALFALDNLWDGLGALAIEHPNMKYFFGKMTMYPEYNREARDLIQHFLFKHFEDKDKLVVPMEPLVIETPVEKMDAILTEKEFKDDYKLLNAEVRRLGVNIPPLVNSYMSLSPTMRMFGGGVNHEFSEAEETCIMISFDDIYDAKKSRHIDSFIQEKVEVVKRRFPLFAENMGDDLTEMIAQKRAQVQARVDERRRKRRERREARRENRRERRTERRTK
ncbi:MAG: GNAT family N-acetyltransferase [Bacteroidales bacterium]|nr:GNAT family N-acetyltransferase [Bacteroidales bacterium]